MLRRLGALWGKDLSVYHPLKAFKVKMNDIPNAAADIIQRIMETAKAAVPDSLSNDVRENVKAAIQDVISDLDVVTREELDTQKAVLEKTRAKVDEMESIIADLEKRLDL